MVTRDILNCDSSAQYFRVRDALLSIGIDTYTMTASQVRDALTTWRSAPERTSAEKADFAARLAIAQIWYADDDTPQG